MVHNATANQLPEWLDALPQDWAVIEENIERYARAMPAHEKWSEIATICTNFLEGKQWTDAELSKLKREGRPIVTKNMIASLFRILQGYQRQNRYECKFMPASDGTGVQETAEALTACAKQISENNQLDWVSSQVFQDGMTTGRGFWDCRMDFSRNGLGDVLITGRDPHSVLIDPEADAYDPDAVHGGWNYTVETSWMSPVDIFMMYGDAAYSEVISFAQTGMPASSLDYNYVESHFKVPERYFGMDFFLADTYSRQTSLYASPWHHINMYRKLVRVIDCQHRKLKKVRYFYDLETGGEAVIPDTFDNEKISRIVQWVRARNYPFDVREGWKKMVRWTVTAGNRKLWDEWSPYNDKMTLVPFFPYFRRGKTRGMIEDLLDPQREVNKRAASLLHVVMTTANSGWMWEENSLSKEVESAIEAGGARPGVNIKYREGYQAPQKIMPSTPPTSYERLEDRAGEDLKKIAGVNDSALGNLDRVQSGRAIQARQKQTIVGAEPYFDNFSRSCELLYRKELFIIQNYYTEPRIVKAVTNDGSTELTWINLKNAAGEIVNNVASGNYMVAVDEAPVSATFMQAQFQEMIELINLGVPIPWDIAIEMSSMPNKNEIIQRLKAEVGLNMNTQLYNNLLQRMQLGVPVEQPLPPVAVDMNNVTTSPVSGMRPPLPPQQGAMPLPNIPETPII